MNPKYIINNRIEPNDQESPEANFKQETEEDGVGEDMKKTPANFENFQCRIV